MKSTLVISLSLLAATAFLPACDKVEDAKAAGNSAMEAVGNLDADGMKTMVGDLSTKLGDIKDLASAEKITEQIGPMLEKLSKGKELLGGKMDLGSLSTAVESLKARFADKADVLKVLQPVLERLTALIK